MSETLTHTTWRRPMDARDPAEENRSSTTLELFFDLSFVAAVSYASGVLEHGLVDGRLAHVLPIYAMVFFAIWWAWMNFTWFASAFDTDDGLYRVATFVQIAGALVVAAGISRVADHNDFGVMTAGYVVMRAAMVGQWLRAARANPNHRKTAQRYALGITAVQLLWVARLLLPDGVVSNISVPVLVLCELLVPAVSEGANLTPWHVEHITERYGLFTLIVLGESVLAVTVAFQQATLDSSDVWNLVPLALSGLAIAFSVWWIYFQRPATNSLSNLKTSLLWGYGHYFMFASIAAIGGALEAIVEQHHAGRISHGPGLLLGRMTAIFLMSSWALQMRTSGDRGRFIYYATPVFAALAIAVGYSSVAAQCIAGLLVLLILADSLDRPGLSGI